MYSKFHLIYVLLFVGMLELSTVVRALDEEVDSSEFRELGYDVRCKLQPNGWDCFRNRTVLHRFYYDITMQSCKTYQYGGCDLNLNSFTTLEECSSICHIGDGGQALTSEKMKELATGVACSLQHDFGTCFNYYPMYYFDTSSRSCKGFSYSGCGGNRNRFTNAHECMDLCESAIPKYHLVRRKRV